MRDPFGALPRAKVSGEDATLGVGDSYGHTPVGITINPRASRCANVGVRSAQGDPEGTAPSALDDPTGMLPWSSSVSKCMLKHAAN